MIIATNCMVRWFTERQATLIHSDLFMIPNEPVSGSDKLNRYRHQPLTAKQYDPHYRLIFSTANELSMEA